MQQRCGLKTHKGGAVVQCVISSKPDTRCVQTGILTCSSAMMDYLSPEVMELLQALFLVPSCSCCLYILPNTDTRRLLEETWKIWWAEKDFPLYGTPHCVLLFCAYVWSFLTCDVQTCILIFWLVTMLHVIKIDWVSCTYVNWSINYLYTQFQVSPIGLITYQLKFQQADWSTTHTGFTRWIDHLST